MAYRPRLKICGVTNAEDARLVAGSGADYCGVLVNVGFSERSLSLDTAKEVASESAAPVVILLCDPPAEVVAAVAREIAPHAVQLLGREPPELIQEVKSGLACQVWKTLHLPAAADQVTAEEYVGAGADAFLLDSTDASEGFLRLGGTGKLVDWEQAAAVVREIPKPVFLAGGIHAGNIEAAVVRVRPFGVDLCTGAEASKGKKDPEKVRRLVEAFRAAVTRIEEGEA
ncbi:MAG: phosphoribosylanthranilate isomerase [bacterium]|nr:phosphoribosylanthranilate isomerase [bacterium]